MYTQEELLEMLKSDIQPVRYDACERLRYSKESSPEIIRALVHALQDQDGEVAGTARAALKADVHRHMAIQMGMAEPEENHSDFEGSGTHQILPGDFTVDQSAVQEGYSLSPESHARLEGMMTWVGLVGFIPLFLGLCIRVNDYLFFQKYFAFLFLSTFLLPIVISFIPWLLPVSCSVTGCHGKVKKSKFRISAQKVNLHYYCQKCGNIYEKDIYRPRTSGHGGGGK